MEYLRQPWKHQLEAIRRQQLLNQSDPQDSGFFLAFEPGAGKSMTAWNMWRHRANQTRKIPRTIIFCPPIVVPNWRNEILLNSKLDRSRITLLTGDGKRRQKRFLENSAGPHVFITNYESLLMKDLYNLFRLWQPEALIFDESHELKNYKSKRSKIAEELANRGPITPLKFLLSGTPLLKDAMDLFQQFKILDGGRTFGHNFFVFQSRYFRDRNAGMPKERYFPNWELMTLKKDGFDAEAAIQAAMAPKLMSVKKSECMDLPPFVQQTIEVEMSPEQARLYREMERDFVTYMDDKACVATLAMTKALRLQQIASGYVRDIDQQDHEIKDTPKMAALEELLREITPSGKVLIWAVYKQNYQQIRRVCEKLKLKYVEINGEVSETQRNEAVRRINEDPATSVCIGHPGSGGVGVNLIAAKYSIFYSRTFSLKESIQAEARNYRGGSEIHEKITRYDLVCRDSIDQLVQKKLALKIELSDKLLRDLSLELRSKLYE